MLQPLCNRKTKILGLCVGLVRDLQCRLPTTSFAKIQSNANSSSSVDAAADDVATLCNILHITNNSVNSSTYVSLLQGCIQKRALSEGKLIHAHINQRGFVADMLLHNTVINMYVKCGSVVDARRVFNQMLQPNVCSWTVMIAAYARNGFPEEALTLFRQMRQTGVLPNQFTFASVLPACAILESLEEGIEIHEEIIRNEFQSDVFVANALVDMYAKCGRIETARDVFDKIPKPNIVSLTTMVAGYTQAGYVDEAFRLFQRMSQRDVCSWTAMITGYAQNGFVDEALELFRAMPQRDIISWNAIIAGLTQNGFSVEALELFRQMQLAGVKPNLKTFAGILPGCIMEHGMEIHEKIVVGGFESSIVLLNALIDMYARCRSIEKAHILFDKMHQRDVVSWTAMIAGYVQKGLEEEALNLFDQMHLAGVKPDTKTFASILPACASLVALEQGKKIHEHIIKSGFQSDIIVVNALIDMYAKCRCMQKARELFDEMHPRDVISWTAIIAGHVQNGLEAEALKLFHQMQLTGLKPSSKTFMSILPACTSLEALEQGMEVHGSIIKGGFQSVVAVTNALIDMYAKCGNVQKAYELFEKIQRQDVVSWTAMITGYSQNGQGEEALKLFREMQLTGVKPDSMTFASILSACAKVASLDHGMEVHEKVIGNGFWFDMVVVNALVDMYAKCGSIKKAQELFDKMHQRDIVSWTAMIAGYAMHGYGKEALKLFETMKQSGPSPDHATFVCILSACNHAGLVDEGYKYFNSMSSDYHMSPTMEHYSCMVDLLGRAGHLDEAKKFLNNIPVKVDSAVWGCLLGACRIHHNVELGERVAEHIFELDPKSAGSYVLLSNIYAAAGRWDDIEKEKGKGHILCHHCENIEIAFGLLNTSPGTTIQAIISL